MPDWQRYVLFTAMGLFATALLFGFVLLIRHQNALWAKCAARHGLTHTVKNVGSQWMANFRSSIHLNGTIRGLPVQMVESWQKIGRHREYETVLQSRARAPAAHTFSCQISRRSLELAQKQRLQTGDATLDAMVSLQSESPRLMLALLAPAVRKALFALPRNTFALSYDQGALRLSFPNPASSARDLDAPIQLILALAEVELR